MANSAVVSDVRLRGHRLRCRGASRLRGRRLEDSGCSATNVLALPSFHFSLDGVVLGAAVVALLRVCLHLQRWCALGAHTCAFRLLRFREVIVPATHNKAQFVTPLELQDHRRGAFTGRHDLRC